MTDSQESLLEFPCKFPIKVMGHSHPQFAKIILDVVRDYAPDLEAEHITLKHSKKGNYLGATVLVQATSKEQLDKIYLALTSHDIVKVVF